MVEYEDDDDSSAPNSIAPELIPITEPRKTRENDMDDIGPVAAPMDVVENSDVSAGAGVEGLDTLVAEREVRDDVLLEQFDADIEMDSNLEARSQKCTKDGDKCMENAGCCSAFCSWTRDFTCYTVAG